MRHRIGWGLVLSLVLVFSASCQKLGEPVQGGASLSVERLQSSGAIPAAWGKLVSTSSCPVAKEWIQLWFQDDAGNIRMVPYNLEKNALLKDAVVLRRD